MEFLPCTTSGLFFFIEPLVSHLPALLLLIEAMREKETTAEIITSKECVKQHEILVVRGDTYRVKQG